MPNSPPTRMPEQAGDAHRAAESGTSAGSIVPIP